MKIVLCCRVYSVHNRVGGMIHVAVERAEALARAGHEVHVVTSNYGGATESVEVNGVSVHAPDGGLPQQYSDDYSIYCEHVAARVNPQILHLDSYDKNRLWFGRFKKQCRVAVTNHGEAIGSQLTDWRLMMHGRSSSSPSQEVTGGGRERVIDVGEWLDERAALLGADVVLTTCRFDRWMLSDLLNLPNVKLVYNPLAPYHFESRKPYVTGKISFLCVGVWGDGERGFDVAQEAVNHLPSMTSLVRPKDVSRRELVEYYDRSTALLLPGFQSKGYDLAVAESIARQRPVIMADNGIATMEAIDRPWIITVPAGDVGALCNAMERRLVTVPVNAADEHRPENHVENWIKAIMG